MAKTRRSKKDLRAVPQEAPPVIVASVLDMGDSPRQG